jgi:4'-phosphopantetheinyl transferase
VDPVDVHWIDMDAPGGAIARLGALLDDVERARAARFRFDRDRRRYIVRHGRLRQLLGGYLGCAPARVRLAWGRFGKPIVAGGGLHFSVSKSRRLALYAVALDREVGCDVEYRDARYAAQRIAERFFSPAEVRALRGLDPARQTEGFFNCWTRKEAYLKARGDGLGAALDSFDVTLAPGEPAALLRGGDGWSVAAFEPAPGFQAAVVAAGADCRINRCPPGRRFSGPWPGSSRRRSPASRDRSVHPL